MLVATSVVGEDSDDAVKLIPEDNCGFVMAPGNVLLLRKSMEFGIGYPKKLWSRKY